jgi:hypothetical protein
MEGSASISISQIDVHLVVEEDIGFIEVPELIHVFFLP